MQENERVIRITKEDASFYINRLVKLCELRQETDAGNLGFHGYWATDKAYDPEVYTNKEGITKTRLKIAQLPIYPDGKGGRGLRYGVLHAIYGTRNMLHEMGLGQEADEILIFDRTMPGGNKLLGDGKTK